MNNRRLLRDISSITPSIDVDNVIDFPTKSSITSPYDKLTVETVLAQYRAGALPEAVLLYLLAGTDGSMQIGTDGSLQILELSGRVEEWALSHLLAVGDGQFAGTHDRYVLRSKVECLGAMEMAT
jgi:hypothetical protein